MFYRALILAKSGVFGHIFTHQRPKLAEVEVVRLYFLNFAEVEAPGGRVESPTWVISAKVGCHVSDLKVA